MVTPRVISFTGLAGAGKTTAAEMCRARYLMTGQVARPVSFAAPLRELCKLAFPWIPPEYFDGNKAQKEAPIPNMPEEWTGRRILQHIGTEGFRAIDPDIWVKLADRSVLTMPEHVALMTFDDVRFSNEATMVRKHGPLYRIVRPGLSVMSHASEREILELEVDGEIVNDGTLTDLHNKVLDVCFHA